MSVTSAAGFSASGIAAGIRSSGKLDLALVVNTGPHRTAAGVFTSNRVKAAPVRWSEHVLAGGELAAVVLNSGGANACTGSEGYRDTVATAARTAASLGVPPGQVAVCSTGLIGQRLPMPALLVGVDAAASALSTAGGEAAAQAIMTTDVRPKNTHVRSAHFSLGGMAKGAGMLAPSLATMLCVLTTDAVVEPATLDKALREATRLTFDRLDSDGCMSTNDTVLLLASGASGHQPSITSFTDALTAACQDLATQLLADAEGATKDISITVASAASEADALEVGRSIARSALLKCALFGNDANWGRVLAAIGTTRAQFDSERLDVAINDVWVCRSSTAAASRSTVNLTEREVRIQVDLHSGIEQATIWTNDLSLAYVHENSAYSS
ncbi:MAG: bifunctional ornithine acetyltransferase/N-acetylglutamate synthase [Acidimicrobiales bacterium]|nr:MAG: bifunctional ornithine acetyltransferase/N-acetylglutamate synthase [Acidimicrobiales bacterium]